MMSKLMDKILKNSTTKLTSVLTDSVLFKDKDVISMDVPILNVAFSGKIDGGITSGLTLLAGPSKSFKSLMSLIVLRGYLNKYPDAVGILYDSEGGMTPDNLKSMGIDTDRIVHIPIEHMEMLKFDIVKQLSELNRGDHVIIVIDSIGNTASQKELVDALDEKSVAEMQRAKTIKGLFRMVTPSLVIKDIPCICICHTYSTMELYSKQIISGGSGLIYSANQAFIIGKSQEKDGTELSGWNFTLNVEKSRYVKEKSKLPLQVLYEGGIQKYSGILDLALESGHVIKPSNGWFSLVDTETGEVSDKKVRSKETQTDEFLGSVVSKQSFKDFVANKYKMTQLGEMAVEPEDSEEE
jgi:RecA/RadA recombinase